MDAHARVDTQVVGALPVVGAILEQWGLAGIVDEVAPWEGDVPLGTLVEVLVMNRLLNPQAMYALGDWAAGAAVTDYFGLTAEQLNDDRLGRALERIADHGAELQSAATLAAVKQWQLKVKQIHFRKNLKGQPMYGLYPENRPSPAPTGARLLQKFATLCVVAIHDASGTHRRLAQLSSIQRKILQLLDLPDAALKTFKRRCGT